MMSAFMKIFSLFILLVSLQVNASVEVQKFDTPEQEQMYKKLIYELRCLVCQNQNLADSNAELAQDLRKKVVDMIYAGNSEQEIIEYMVIRYGDFVLYRPPVNQRTWLLWFGPFVILLVGLLVLVMFVNRQKNKTKPSLSDEQQKRAKKLLDEDDSKDDK